MSIKVLARVRSDWGREHPERSGASVRAAQSKDAALSDGRSAPFDCGLRPSAQGAPLLFAAKSKFTQAGPS